MVEYPSDWLCKCGHKKADHGPAGLQKNMCKIGDSVRRWVDNCVEFSPIDNLTYVELLAEAKEVLK